MGESQKANENCEENVHVHFGLSQRRIGVLFYDPISSITMVMKKWAANIYKSS